MKGKSGLIFILSWFSEVGLFIFFVSKPIFAWQIFVISMVLLFSITYLLVGRSSLKASLISFLIFPVITCIAMYLAATLPSDKNLVYLIGVFASYLVSYYFMLVNSFITNRATYKIGSLENFSSYASLAVVLLLCLSFFGFNAFLDSPYWLSMPALMIGLISVFYYFFWSNKISWSDFRLPLAISALITTQLAFSISELPFDYFTSAVLLVVIIYATINTLRLDLQDKLTIGKIKHYFAFVTLSFVIIYLSAQWL